MATTSVIMAANMKEYCLWFRAAEPEGLRI
jgi:hypothetical protein